MLSSQFLNSTSLRFKREKFPFGIFCDSHTTSVETVDPQKCSQKGKHCLKTGGIDR